MKNADMPANSNRISSQDYSYWAAKDGKRIKCVTSSELTQINSGLSKREYAAIATMHTVLSKYDPYEYGDFDSSDWEDTAKNAVGLADALFRELDKGGES